LLSGLSQLAEVIKDIVGKRNVADEHKLFMIRNRKPGEAFNFPT